MAEQARLDLHARQPVAIGRDAGDLLIGQARLERDRFGGPEFFVEPLEASAFTRRDLDDGGQLVDRALQVGDLLRVQLERVGGVVAREHDAVAVGDDAAVGRLGLDIDAVRFGQLGEVLVLDDLQIEEAAEDERERGEDRRTCDQEPLLEAGQLGFGVSEFGRHGTLRLSR